MPVWCCLVLAAVAGFTFGVQGPANGALARAWGLPYSVALNGGLVFLGTLIGILIFGRDEPFPRFDRPLTHYVGGLCGLTVICVAAAAVPKIGAADYTVALILGMVAASVLVDVFGWWGQPVIPLSPLRLLGLALIGAGVFLVRWARPGA